MDGVVKSPVGNLIIKINDNNFPKDISYRRLGKSNLIIINVINSSYKSLEEAYNHIQKEDWVKEISIDYVADIIRQSNIFFPDPYYPQQYYLKNTGQFGGTSGIDINIENAWAITKGSSSIKVAVIDDGLESHIDLKDESGVSRIINGYTPAINGNGTPQQSNDGHGVACAGILSASHNNQLTRGVAPNVELLSVNIFHSLTSESDIADGIIWAVDNGSKILSNSWGYNTTSTINAVANAIDYAISNDVVVVFSAGNSGYVSFPGNYPGVVTVNAINRNGNIWNYTGSSPTVDLVAPSGGLNLTGDQYTIDREGNNGYSSNDYITSFGGTSGAAPQVAGAFALLYSLNPLLTASQAKSIIYNTATDMGPVGKDNSYGHGRLNVYEALKTALPIVHSTHIGFDQTLGYTLLTGTNTVDQDTDLTIKAGEAVVLDGSLIGDFDSKLKVYGTLIVEEDAVVSELHTTVYTGGRLIIRPGAQITFRNNQQLNVQTGAELIAVGTPSKPIHFDKATSSNWRYLFLKGMVELKHVVISNTQYGIYLNNNDWLDMADSKISNSSSFGIYAISGYMDLFRSVIENSGTDGINASNWSTINHILDTTPVQVVIRNSNRYGIYANNNSGVYLSQYLGYYGGYNSVYGNMAQHLYATNYSDIGAGLTWWGQYPINPAKYYKDYTSSMYYGDEFSFDPNPSMKILPTNEQLNTDRGISKIDSIESSFRSSFLNKLAELRRTGNKEEVFNYVQGLAENTNHEFNKEAKLVIIQALASKGNYKSSNSLAFTLFNDSAKSQEEQIFAGIQLVQNHLDYINFNVGEDISKEIPTIIDKLELLGFDKEQLAMYRDLSVRNVDSSENYNQVYGDIVTSNFPNPFNPTTNIQFTLPNQADVTLIVYDMIGREVALLLQGSKDAGTHTVSFDASNLASGMYFYIIQAGNARITQKMSLIK